MSYQQSARRLVNDAFTYATDQSIYYTRLPPYCCYGLQPTAGVVQLCYGYHHKTQTLSHTQYDTLLNEVEISSLVYSETARIYTVLIYTANDNNHF